jgi:ABC-type nitrate/sulfonate/bicarbonate transport system permease component
MWDIIVLLGLLGIVLNGVFALVERRVLAWQHGSASASN